MASLLVPLLLDLSASLPPEFLPIAFCVFCVVPSIEPLYETTANRKSLLIDALFLRKLLYHTVPQSGQTHQTKISLGYSQSRTLLRELFQEPESMTT